MNLTNDSLIQRFLSTLSMPTARRREAAPFSRGGSNMRHKGRLLRRRNARRNARIYR